MSRAKTVEEMRGEFLGHIRTMVRYWSGEMDPSVKARSKEDALDGLAFSILSAIDGSSVALPAIDLVPSPHPDDKQYCQDNDYDWWEPTAINGDCHLHELWYSEEWKKERDR